MSSVHHTTLMTSNINIHSGVTKSKQSTFSNSLASTPSTSITQATTSIMNQNIQDNISATASLESTPSALTKADTSQYNSLHSTKSLTTMTMTTNAFITSKNSLAAVSTSSTRSFASISSMMEGSANIEAVGKLMWLAAAVPLAFV